MLDEMLSRGRRGRTQNDSVRVVQIGQVAARWPRGCGFGSSRPREPAQTSTSIRSASARRELRSASVDCPSPAVRCGAPALLGGVPVAGDTGRTPGGAASGCRSPICLHGRSGLVAAQASPRQESESDGQHAHAATSQPTAATAAAAASSHACAGARGRAGARPRRPCGCGSAGSAGSAGGAGGAGSPGGAGGASGTGGTGGWSCRRDGTLVLVRAEIRIAPRTAGARFRPSRWCSSRRVKTLRRRRPLGAEVEFRCRSPLGRN